MAAASILLIRQQLAYLAVKSSTCCFFFVPLTFPAFCYLRPKLLETINPKLATISPEPIKSLFKCLICFLYSLGNKM